jgi:predicted metal-dependent hydrolase
MHKFLQMTLDFLGAAPQAGGLHPSSPTLTPSRQAALEPPAVAFRHPRANREARLGHAQVAYEFRRGKRRTIGFSVGPEGLVVSAPRWVPLSEVHAALTEKSSWIVRKLDEARERRDRIEASRISWEDGAEFAFLGQPVRLRLDPSQRYGGAAAVLHAPQTDGGDAGGPMCLRLGLPLNAGAQQIRDAVQAWLMRQARRIFIERLDHFAPRLQVKWHKLSLSSAGTRWGSARADGSIRLHWRLVHFRMDVIDYVVAHELSHLRVMDHSPRFWETVRAVIPDYERLKGQLKDEAIARWA